MIRVLLVEDDELSREFLRDFIESEGYEPLIARNGEEALELVGLADIILLDVMMPKMSGWDVAEFIRQDYADLPIIMLTALAEPEQRIRGFELGVDDYVIKPYNLRELGLRIKALLRRSNIVEQMSFGSLRIDAKRREVSLEGHKVQLSKIEFDLLFTLAMQPGLVFSRNRLLERIWGADYNGVDRVVDVHVTSLRKKLSENTVRPRFIETVRGVGYKFKAG